MESCHKAHGTVKKLYKELSLLKTELCKSLIPDIMLNRPCHWVCRTTRGHISEASISAYGNVILGWTEAGFQKAEEDSRNNAMAKTSLDDIDPGMHEDL